MNNLVSVIIPVYNSERYIEDTLLSVANQTYTTWEIIIVDDASTDNSYKIIKKFIDQNINIKYERLEVNSGAAIARNRAIELANGVYLAFLDSDDVWSPNKLKNQIAFMEINNYSFTCTNYSKIDEFGNSMNKIIKAKPQSDYDGILKTCPGNSTVVYNAKELGKFYIPNINKRNDYVMWLKVIKKAEKLYGLNETLGNHRIHSEGISSNKFSLVKYHWYVYRKIEKIGILKSSYLILYWIYMTVFRLR